MFDDDDLFDLTDGSFEWDLLLDDDELEQVYEFFMEQLFGDEEE